MIKYTQSNNQVFTQEDISWGSTEKDNIWYSYFVDIIDFQAVLNQGATEITEQEYRTVLGI